jgi:diguanylate cyclase (GGDEF)-like protein/PAS domain S-box-containing protein
MVEANLRFALTDRFQPLSVRGDVETLLGFTSEDFLSSRVSLKDRIHPQDSDIAAILFSPETGNKAGTFNIRIRHADGRIRCIKGHYTREFTPGSREAIVDLLLQDAKSLWKGPETQSTTAHFRALMENTDDFIFFKDRNHVYTGASQNLIKASENLGNDFGILGQTDYDIAPEVYADIYYRLEKQVFEGMDVAHEVHESLSVDGRMVWADNRKYPIRNNEGEIIGLFGIVRDVTERMQAMEKLRVSAESLLDAQRIAGLGSFVLDMATGAWTRSDVLNEVYGIDKDYEHTRAAWVALIHPDDRAMMNGYLAREVIGKRQNFSKEYRIIRPVDQGVRWLHAMGKLELDASGKPVVVRGTIQDITERKEADSVLRESKELLQLFIDHAPAALAMFDREMRFVAVSRRWRETYCLGERELIGRLRYETPPGVPEHWRESHRRGLAGETTRGDDDHFECEGCPPKWLRWEVRPWRRDDGEVGGIVIFSEDITEQKNAEAAVRQSRDLLQLFIEHAPAALSMYDREMRLLAVSRRGREDFCLGDREVVGRSAYEILPEIPERWKEAHRRGLAGESTRVDEDRFERANGNVQWLRWEVRPWMAGDGEVGGIIVFSENITRQKLAEERLQLAASVFTHAREGIMITDPDGTILDVNDTFTRITGYARAEVLGLSPRLLSSGLHGKEFYTEMWRDLREKGQWSGEVWNRNKNGKIYPEMETVSAVFDASGNTREYVSLFSDITLLKEHERKLEHIAHYDVLTGLPNRVLLADRLHQAIAQSRRRQQLLAVAYLDLDGFKVVNDRHGHDAGDMLLTALAGRMKEALREGDTLARLGGDEFVAVLLDLTDVEASVPVLSRLLQAAAEPAQIGDLVLQVSASIGVTFFPQPEDVDADLLLRQADQAMYQAKLSGRNSYHIFDSSRDRSVRGHLEDVANIRQALAQRQFVLYFQPEVNMRTGAVTGAEALIRWQHPERGLLPPAMFLPVIEDHPLAIELGEWVIDTALAQMESWNAQGFDIPVSVNVGALQLQQGDFAARLGVLLAAHPNINPSSLKLEVVETSALRDVVKVSHLINACAELGVSFALDDFGTGYSSLTYLKRLPAKFLKIDQSFVRGILDDAEDLSIIEGVMGLATAFQRQVIAEGVETVEHGLILLHLGCELAQGYGIARPMPANELPGWAARWRPEPSWATALPVSPGDRPLLYAAVEHRAWITATEAFLKGERRLAPPMTLQDCRFGAWLDEGGLSGRGSQAALLSVETVHRRVHALAAEIFALQAEGRNLEGLARLGELNDLRDALLEQLKDFRQKS